MENITRSRPMEKHGHKGLPERTLRDYDYFILSIKCDYNEANVAHF